VLLEIIVRPSGSPLYVFCCVANAILIQLQGMAVAYCIHNVVFARGVRYTLFHIIIILACSFMH